MEEFACDLLLFFATTTEREQLREVAKELGFPFNRGKHPQLGRYYRIGMVGDFRVLAVQTEMGPLNYQGSASQGIYYKSATGATAIVQLGMAFGIDPGRQKPGDVLVSNSIIPYDRRNVHADGEGYRVDYGPAKRQAARPFMVELFLKQSQQEGLPFQVHLGALLLGGAAIFSGKFRDELVRAIPPTDEPIVGGEMEGVGLVSVSPPEDPAWIVMKGISDFADEQRDKIFEETRPRACRNSAWFVLSALAKTKPP